MHPQSKTVLITGASAGIGAATAQAFSAAGARVVLTARDEAKLREVAGGLSGPSLVIPSDVTDQLAMRELVRQTIETFGGIDILINNAGIGLAAPVAEMQVADLQQVLDVNLFGPLALTQAALPCMRQSRRGQLIFVSSVVSMRALPYLSGYAASKAALERLCEALRVELDGSGIVVTVVRPGTTKTAFSTHRLGQGRERRRLNAHAATPEQVAQVIIRAAIREPRVAYSSWSNRLMVLLSLVAPRLIDRILGRSFAWDETSTAPPSRDRAAG